LLHLYYKLILKPIMDYRHGKSISSVHLEEYDEILI